MPLAYFDAFTHFGAKPHQHAAQRWTLTHLLEDLDRSGVAGAMVMHTAQVLGDPDRENRRLLDLIGGHGRLKPIWVAMPGGCGDIPDPASQVKAMDSADVRMVALFPKSHGWSLRSETSRPLLETLEACGRLTVLEYGTEADADDIERIAGGYPRLPLLIRGVHWSQARLIVPLLRRFRNLHLCFDSFQVNRGVEWLAGQGMEDQLVFASNAVDMSMGAHRTVLDYAELDPVAHGKIASGNLCRLLRMDPAAFPPVGAAADCLVQEAQRGLPLSARVLDFHAHILDEGSISAGGANVMWDGGPLGLQRMARRLGIDGVGVMSWNGTVGAQGQEGNRCVQAALDASPELFWGLASFDPVHEAPASIERDMGLLFQDARWKGLKPYFSYGIPYDDPRYDVWWRFAEEHGLYCGLHPSRWYQAGEFESLCRRFPKLVVVAYHSGADFAVADTVIELSRRFPNLYLEITFTTLWGGMVEYLVRGAGVERVLLGTDQPMRDPRPQLGWVLYADLTEEQKRQVLGLNAERLLRRLDGIRNGKGTAS